MSQDRTYPERPIVGVGAVILDRKEERVVVVRRGTEPLRGEWSLPGGMLELGETLHAGVKREVLEETGLTVIPEGIAGVFDRIVHDDNGRPQYHYVLVDYICRVAQDSGELKAASDVDEARWVAEGELDSLPVVAFTADVIRQVLKSRVAAD
jgi:ADP-ribose pyrophosphatase YjhB (NUDIX family)